MVVSGGVTWWKDFICVACYNIIGHRDEVRYRLHCLGKLYFIIVKFATYYCDTTMFVNVSLCCDVIDLAIAFLSPYCSLYSLRERGSRKHACVVSSGSGWPALYFRHRSATTISLCIYLDWSAIHPTFYN